MSNYPSTGRRDGLRVAAVALIGDEVEWLAEILSHWIAERYELGIPDDDMSEFAQDLRDKLRDGRL